MDVQWFSKSFSGVVSIYETNITLNTVASNHFKNAYSTIIGFDKSNNTLIIKALDKEEAVLPKYNASDLHRISIRPSYGRINGKGIIKNINKFFKLDFNKKKQYKFKCEWDPSHKFLIVYLEKEVE